MNTRELARQLDAIEIIYIDKKTTKKPIKQPFDYLLVLDFEATCWDRSDVNKGNPEIIEFPVVLYNVQTREIVDEFQQYVLPTEHPNLSAFCTSLTGIQQHQIDDAVSLPTCLFLFMRWISEKMALYDMDFPNTHSNAAKKCIFATWTNWDLGNCLKKECNRKKINLHGMFRHWIDIKAVFKTHYQRSFRGLVGALAEVGLYFEGNPHCGLHDARNTARLVGQMITDGVILKKSK